MRNARVGGRHPHRRADRQSISRRRPRHSGRYSLPIGRLWSHRLFMVSPDDFVQICGIQAFCQWGGADEVAEDQRELTTLHVGRVV